MVFESHLCHMPQCQQFGCCPVLHLVTAWAAPAVPDWVLAVLKMDLVSAHFGLAVLLFPYANFADPGVPVVVVHPTSYSKHHHQLHLDFADHHIEIRQSSENIQVARPRAGVLLGLVAARQGMADLSRCSMLVGLCTGGCHLPCRRHSRKEGGSVE